MQKARPYGWSTLMQDEREASLRGTQGSMRFLTRLEDRTFEDGAWMNGKRTVSRRLMMSPNGRTLTVTMDATIGGQAVTNVAVYEKQ
jgi:hypothetical protein